MTALLESARPDAAEVADWIEDNSELAHELLADAISDNAGDIAGMPGVMNGVTCPDVLVTVTLPAYVFTSALRGVVRRMEREAGL